MDQALIGILGVVLGVILSNIGARLLESVRRRERIQDMSTAIRAEIRSHRQRLLLFKAEAGEDMARRILSDAKHGSSFTPFVPKEAPSFVFEAVLGEIHILPTQVIDPVVYYYRQIVTLSQFAEDLRGESFARLEPPRKAEMYRDYIGVGAYALELAELAISALEDRSVSGLRSGGTGNRSGRR